MSVFIDELILDAKALLAAALKYAVQLAETGVSAEDLQAMPVKIEQVRSLDVTQKDTKNISHEATREQNSTLLNGMTLIRKVQKIAKRVFKGADKATLAEFHVGQKISATVKTVRAELAYVKKIAEKYKTVLAPKGLKDADIEQLATLEAELADKEVTQDDLTHTSFAATGTRDKAAADLREAIADIRAGAQLAFEDKHPEILAEFETIFNHHKKKAAPAPIPTAVPAK